MVAHFVGEISAVLAYSVGTDLVRCGDMRVELAGGLVAREPRRFAVVGIIAPAVVLFLTGVYNGDAVG